MPMKACPDRTCTGVLIKQGRAHHVLDARPFYCNVCGTRVHPRACYDDEGKLECVCGLADDQERAADREPDVPTLRGDDAVRFVESAGLGDLGALFGGGS